MGGITGLIRLQNLKRAKIGRAKIGRPKSSKLALHV
jgi:hypothetical protein